MEFRFPDVGEGITEGEIVKWHVKPGDKVSHDQVLVEMETDKAVVQIPSPAAGTITELKHKEGDTVKVGEVLIVIDESGKPSAKVKEGPKAEPAEEKKSFGVVGVLEEAKESPVIISESHPHAKMIPKGSKSHILVSPATRRLARELHVDLTVVEGSGHEGRITEEDVRGASDVKPKDIKKAESIAKGVSVQKSDDIYGPVQRLPLKGIRKSIARHMSQSMYTAVHVTHMDEIDVTHLVQIREKEKKRLEKKKIKLTYLPFAIKAVVAGLKKHPELNATLDDEHEEILFKKYYNIGIAVDTPDGLMVPNVKQADRKKIPQLAKELQVLSEQARTRSIDINDMKGGTFTITNVGSLGGVFATPVINYPEVAILALGRIYDKPVVRKGQIVIRKYMPFSLTFDHRVLDGAQAARFANHVKSYLEHPDRFLVE